MLIAAFPPLQKAAEHCTRTSDGNKSVQIGACQFRRGIEDLVELIRGEKTVSTGGLCGRRAKESKIENVIAAVASRSSRSVFRGPITISNATLLESHMCVSSVNPRRP